MLSKMQKTWLWIFGGMFLIPEILFWFTPLSILSFMNNFSEMSIKPLAYLFINPRFFIDHQIYLFCALAIEWLGVFGLIVMSIKSRKYISVALLIVVLLWLSFLLMVAYSLNHMGF